MARNQTYEELKQRVKVLEKEAAKRKRAEEALRESEEQYRHVVESVRHVGILVAQDGKLAFINTAISDILGYTKEELTSHPNPFDFIHPDDRTMVLERHMKRLKGERATETYPYRIITRDGSIKWVEVTGAWLDWRGKPATLNFFTDITARKRTEDSLRESEEKYRRLVQQSKDAIFLMGMEDNTFFASHACHDIFGYDPDEFMKDRGLAARILQTDSRKQYNKFWQHYKTNGVFPDHVQEWAWKHKNGQTVYTENIFTNIFNDQGMIIGFQTIARDITERKRSEKALEKSEKKYRDLVENISDVIYTIDTDGVMTYISPAIKSILDYSPAEIIGKPVIEFVHKDDLTRLRKRFEETLSGHIKPSEYRVLSKSGEIHWILTSSKLIFVENRVIGVQGVLTDITERKQSEESLQKSEEQYRLLADNVIDIISRHSLDGTILYVSPSVSALLGYEPRELIGTNGFDPLIPQDDLPKIQSKILGLLNEEHSSDQIEHRMIKKNGNHVWVETTSRLRQNTDSDQSFEVISVTREITERKQANLDLKEKEQKLERQSQHLEEVNTALKILLEHREEEKKNSEKNILSNVQKLIFPYIEKLENSRLDNKNKTYVDIIRSNLKELMSPFGNTLSSKYAMLTPTEIQIADLIKHGRASKEIASLLNVSPKAISFHRGNIRRKLGLVNKKINLRSHLQSLAT